MDGPLFRPVRGNREGQDGRRHLHPDIIDRVLRKYARKIGVTRGYSAHSMRATFITTALDNGASLEDVQSAAGHADPSTTKLYDRRGGFDHGVGHPLLLLCGAKVSNYRKNKECNDLGHYSEWPKVADAVIKAGGGIIQRSRRVFLRITELR